MQRIRTDGDVVDMRQRIVGDNVDGNRNAHADLGLGCAGICVDRGVRIAVRFNDDAPGFRTRRIIRGCKRRYAAAARDKGFHMADLNVEVERGGNLNVALAGLRGLPVCASLADGAGVDVGTAACPGEFCASAETLIRLFV